jgi:hypothetical protein
MASKSDKARIFITDSLGHRQLKQTESFEPNQDGSIANIMGLNGEVIGSARTGGGWTITIGNRLNKGVPDEVDWYGLLEDDEEFVLERQLDGNVREVYDPCRVATAPVSSDNQGTVMRTVTINAEKMQTA